MTAATAHRLRRLSREDGFALVAALGVSVVLGIVGATAVAYATTNAGTATRSRADQTAFALAEAGVNNAMSVLSNPSVNALDPRALCPDASTPLPCSTTSSYEGGTVTWTGTLNRSLGVWHLSATGYMRNPTGPKVALVRRTTTADVPVLMSHTQPLNNMAWNYIYTTKVGDPDGCDESLDNVVNMGSPLYVNGNLCLNTPSNITGGPTVVKGKINLDVNTNIGTSANPINEAHVAGGCQFKNQALHSPCSSADQVYARTIDTTIPPVTTPVADFAYYYANASPGPSIACDPSKSYGPVPVLDNDTVRNNSVPGVFNLTPTTSYDCWTANGELKWDAAGQLLTVSGVMYIDGSAKIDNGAVNSYNGQATLYLSGTFFVSNSKLCAGVNADKSDCDFSAWNPNTEMLVVVSDGNGGQVPVGDSIQIKSSRYQGGLYATNKIELDTTAQTEGPMIGSEVIIGQSVRTYTFPYITTVPPGVPGNPNVYAQPSPPQNWG